MPGHCRCTESCSRTRIATLLSMHTGSFHAGKVLEKAVWDRRLMSALRCANSQPGNTAFPLKSAVAALPQPSHHHHQEQRKCAMLQHEEMMMSDIHRAQTWLSAVQTPCAFQTPGSKPEVSITTDRKTSKFPRQMPIPCSRPFLAMCPEAPGNNAGSLHTVRLGQGDKNRMESSMRTPTECVSCRLPTPPSVRKGCPECGCPRP